MKLLLDTHVFLWLRSAPGRVSAAAVAAYRDESNTAYLSLVSAWEIQIKQQLGKLDLEVPLDTLIREQCAQNDLRLMDVKLDHVLGLGALPPHHKDPFDRLLIAQARQENAALISSDSQFSSYDVDLLW